MEKSTALFIQTPFVGNHPAYALPNRESEAMDYAEWCGLRVKEKWIVEEDPSHTDGQAFHRFVERVKENPSFEAVLLGSLDDAVRTAQDLAELALLVLEGGVEVHLFSTGHSMKPRSVNVRVSRTEAEPCRDDSSLTDP